VWGDACSVRREGHAQPDLRPGRRTKRAKVGAHEEDGVKGSRAADVADGGPHRRGPIGQRDRRLLFIGRRAPAQRITVNQRWWRSHGGGGVVAPVNPEHQLGQQPHGVVCQRLRCGGDF
jgi:hypothetical protein